MSGQVFKIGKNQSRPSASNIEPHPRIARTILLCLAVLLMTTGAVAQAGDPAVVGQWSAPQPWPLLNTHIHLLPNGKVLWWPSFSNGDNPKYWDPATSALSGDAPKANYNIFCAGHSFLADGRLLVTGGHIASNVGLPTTSTFDFATETWTRYPDMNAGRWYPTNVTLANGDVLVASGTIDTTVGNNPLPQVFEAATGTWRDLTTAQLVLPLYPRMFLAPNGKVFVAGPSSITRYLDTNGTGTWTTVARNIYGYRGESTAIMYDDGKIMIAGGDRPATATAEIINLNAATPTWTSIAPMSSPRRQHNATMLPDGTVLITGGSSGETYDDETHPVYAAELWNSETGAWTTLASQSVYRGYHSTSLLLPDGRVLSAGGNKSLSRNAEVFSPPYLFKGPRPTLTSVPSNVAYGENFVVTSPDAASVTKVTWLRLGSVTHDFDQNQRINRLSFSVTADGSGLNITAPSNANLTPPGHYMLFLLNGNGVPSIAKIIRISPSRGGEPPPSITSINPNQGPVGGGTNINIIGSNFQTGATVSVGGASAINVAVTSTQITATTPAHAAATVDVTVRNPDNQSAISAGAFTYTDVVSNPAPTVTAVTPGSGSSGGGTSVSISGTGFLPNPTVKIGGTTATNATTVNTTSINAVAPPHAIGTVNVVVMNSDNQSGELPALQNVDFEQPGAFWKFYPVSGATGSIKTDSASAHSGTNFAEISASASNQKYVAVDSAGKDVYFPVRPGDVISYGGWVQRVSGSGAVRYNLELYDENKLNPIFVSSGVTPSTPGQWLLHKASYTVPAGKAYVRFYFSLYNPTSASVARFDDAFLSIGFTYVSPVPTVASISPNNGPASGGTAVTITGTNFVQGATVTIGGVTPSNVVVADSTTITAVTPPHTVGPVEVTVANPGSASGSLPALSNTGFESGTAYWKFSGTGTASVQTNATNARSGNNYAELTSVSAGGNQKFVTVDAAGNALYFPVVAGTALTFGGWVSRISGDGSSRWVLALYDANKANATFVNAVNTATSATWTQQLRTYTIPSGKAYAQIFANVYNNTTSTVARFDDATLTVGFTYK
jgi:hypothetical protein